VPDLFTIIRLNRADFAVFLITAFSNPVKIKKGGSGLRRVF
jgi:hypothetical protein